MQLWSVMYDKIINNLRKLFLSKGGMSFKTVIFARSELTRQMFQRGVMGKDRKRSTRVISRTKLTR